MTNDKQAESLFCPDFEKFYIASMGSDMPPWHKVDCYTSWLAAKRNQPVIDMALGQVVELNDFDRGYNQAIHDACIRVEAAGYSYRVKS